ncbi:tryptophan synthase subunit beta [Candidatus Woesearchaeota archaeon]|nr:tryptophan synthase subunit beta [Candidatus Woesearchaeota archaeon]
MKACSQSSGQPSRQFGTFGGTFVPETLMQALAELEHAYLTLEGDLPFQEQLSHYLKDYAGRPTPLYFAKNVSEKVGCMVYLKREDLLHGGAHKTNNALGQVLLAKKMRKTRIIAETGAGQHGIAVAMAAALLGMPAEVYMGVEDIERQQLNVLRMQLCGATVRPVEIRQGQGSLKDAVSEALRDWASHSATTAYVLGSVAGPHPYPSLVRDFQKVIGIEARQQILAAEGRLPTKILACVGGGSNAIGIFHAFLQDDVALIGIEAGGKGEKHGATLSKGSVGIFQGALSYVLQDDFGQIQEAHSISAGLDYPGVGPEHAFLKTCGRASYVSITDDEALLGFRMLAELEGIIPALESAHAVAHLLRMKLSSNDIVILNVSGRGDKDMLLVQKLLEEKR